MIVVAYIEEKIKLNISNEENDMNFKKKYTCSLIFFHYRRDMKKKENRGVLLPLIWSIGAKYNLRLTKVCMGKNSSFAIVN